MITRDRILKAAQHLHAKDGLEAVTMRRVSARVGLAPMALYRHFRDKDALLDALVAEGFAKFETYLQRATETGSPAEQVRAALLAYVDFALDQRRTFELMFFVPRENVPRAPSSLQASSSPSFSRVIAAAGVLFDHVAPQERSELLLLGWSAVHGIIALYFSGRFGADVSAFRGHAERQIDTLLQLLQLQQGSSQTGIKRRGVQHAD